MLRHGPGKLDSSELAIARPPSRGGPRSSLRASALAEGPRLGSPGSSREDRRSCLGWVSRGERQAVPRSSRQGMKELLARPSERATPRIEQRSPRGGAPHRPADSSFATRARSRASQTSPRRRPAGRHPSRRGGSPREHGGGPAGTNSSALARMPRRRTPSKSVQNSEGRSGALEVRQAPEKHRRGVRRRPRACELRRLRPAR